MSRPAMLYCIGLLAVLYATILVISILVGSAFLFIIMSVVGALSLSPVFVGYFTHVRMPDRRD